MRDDLHLHPWIGFHTNTIRTACPMYNTRHPARDLDRSRVPSTIALARSTSSRRLVVVSRVVDGGGDADDGALGVRRGRGRARGGEREDVGRDRARDARARARWGRPRDARARGDGGARDARVGCETVRGRRARREANDRGGRAR
jgi:hypothetical protein